MATMVGTENFGVERSAAGRVAGGGTSARIAETASGRTNGNGERLARGLGWFSIGLGLAEVVRPQAVARLVGISERPSLLRGFGMREIATGLGILATQRHPAGWLWARVGGDLMDLAMIARALRSGQAEPAKAALATAAVAGVTLLDVLAGARVTRPRGTSDTDASEATGTFRKTTTIDRTPDDLYSFWRRLENLPRFMTAIRSVQPIDERRSHWVAQGPGRVVEWDAEIIDDQRGQRIAWRSLDDADVYHTGSVTFAAAAGGRGTRVTIEMDYDPPLGVIGKTLARLLGYAPEQRVDQDLRRFKQLMETGEIATTEGQPAGRNRPPLIERLAEPLRG